MKANKTTSNPCRALRNAGSEKEYFRLVKPILSHNPRLIGELTKDLSRCKKFATGNARKRLVDIERGIKLLCSASYAQSELDKYLDEALDHGRTKAFADILAQRNPSKRVSIGKGLFE